MENYNIYIYGFKKYTKKNRIIIKRRKKTNYNIVK
jgi:hypothetical protein